MPNLHPEQMETWKMNLLAVSEKHRLVVIAVRDKLHCYELDPFSAEIVVGSGGRPKIVDLKNDASDINNVRLVACADREFIVTVDFAAHVRMIYLDDLDKDPIKFTNEYAWAQDNSTWSVDGSSVPSLGLPPRVVVGSNAHSLTIFNLESG